MLRVATVAPRSGILAQCFYCGGKLPARNKEHLFNACWGGNHKSSQLICDDCNAAFAAVDDALSSWTRFVMNAWRVKGQRQKSVPNIPLEGDYDVTPGGKPKLRRPLLNVQSEAGGHEITVEAASKGEARRLLLDGELEQRIGRDLTEEERERLLAGIRQASSEPVFITGRHAAHLRVSDEYRSIAHTALKCAAMYDPGLVQNQITAPIREFARHGKGSWDQFAVIAKQNISPLSTLRRAYGNLFNAVEIYWCASLEKIVAVVTVLGSITKSVILGECDCPDAILCVIEPAFHGGEVKNIFLQTTEATMPLPLLELQEFPVTMATVTREFEVFAGNTLAVDSVLATFYIGLTRLIEQHPQIRPELIADIRRLIIEFVRGITKGTGRTVSAEQVSAELEAAGFRKLEQQLGTSSTTAEVQTLLGHIVVSALTKFTGADSPPPSAQAC